jgi:hypothetical protein
MSGKRARPPMPFAFPFPIMPHRQRPAASLFVFASIANTSGKTTPNELDSMSGLARELDCATVRCIYAERLAGSGHAK